MKKRSLNRLQYILKTWGGAEKKRHYKAEFTDGDIFLLPKLFSVYTLEVRKRNRVFKTFFLFLSDYQTNLNSPFHY